MLNHIQEVTEQWLSITSIKNNASFKNLNNCSYKCNIQVYIVDCDELANTCKYMHFVKWCIVIVILVYLTSKELLTKQCN